MVNSFDKEIQELERDILKVFKLLPEAYRERAVGQIYQRALIKMRNAIRANAPISSKPITFTRKGTKYTYQPGNLRKAISIKYLPPKGTKQYPAALVYVKRGRKQPDGWYAHFLELGTANRKSGRTRRGKAEGANRGRIKPIGFFRRGVDSTIEGVASEARAALAKYSDKILDQQLKRMDLKSRRIKISL